MKRYVVYRLADIDFEEGRYRFCHIELVRVGRETLQLTSTSGRLGTKGKRTMLEEVPFSEKELERVILRARTFMRAKKAEGFRFESDLRELLKGERGKRCDGCGTDIPDDLYAKIDEWARGEGGWDRERTCFGKGKVLCIACQTEHGLYRRRVRGKRQGTATTAMVGADRVGTKKKTATRS